APRKGGIMCEVRAAVHAAVGNALRGVPVRGVRRRASRSSLVLRIGTPRRAFPTGPALVLLALALAGCGPRGGDARDGGPRGPVAVRVVTVKPATIARVVEQPGTVRADEQTQVLAKVPGYVGRLLVDIGSEVKKGELLAELFIPEAVEESNQKQALV